MLCGDFVRAAADYQKAIELESEHPFGYVYRGELYLLRNQPEQAKKDLLHALELPLPKAESSGENWRREKAKAYFWLALLQRDNADQEKQCIEWLEQALKNGFDDYAVLKYVFPWQRWGSAPGNSKIIAKISRFSPYIR